MRSFVCGVVAMASIVAAPVRPAVAQGSAGLLPLVSLTAVDGSVVTTGTLTQPRPWLLVIAQQPCRSCEAALAVLDAVVSAEISARMAIVLSGASAAESAGLRGRYRNLASASWYRDDARAALPALGVGGSPIVVGLIGNKILWTRHVAAMSAGNLESLVTSWIR